MIKNNLMSGLDDFLEKIESIFPRIKNVEIEIGFDSDKCEELSADGYCEKFEDGSFYISLNTSMYVYEIVSVVIHEMSHIIDSVYFGNMNHGNMFESIKEKINKELLGVDEYVK